jgi:transcriptional regulator with XRE-family HTH domain
MKMSLTQIVGRRIRVARIERNVKQADLAEKIDVAPKTLSSWETGSTDIRVHSLEQIAKELGKPVTYFLQPFEAN